MPSLSTKSLVSINTNGFNKNFKYDQQKNPLPLKLSLSKKKMQ